MIEFLVKKAIQLRFPLLVAVVALTFVSTKFLAKNINVSDNSLPVWFDKNDRDYMVYRDFTKLFGNDRFVVLGFEVGHVFSNEVLGFVRELTEALKKIPDVEKVTSITNAEFIEGTRDEILIHPFVEKLPASPAELKILEKKALSEPDFVGHLVSADSKILGIVARVNTAHTLEDSTRLKNEIERVVGALNVRGYAFHLSGSPITDEAFDRLVTRDLKVFTPGVIIFIILVIMLFFRNVLAAVIPALLQIIVVVWITALYYFAGYKMNVVMGMMIPILVSVCVADSVHLMLDYHQAIVSGIGRDKALLASPKHLWRPCLYTALTTLAGFVSFRSSTIGPINDLGSFTALGVAVAFLLTIFFVPVILSFLPQPKKNVATHWDAGFIRVFLEKTERLNKRHPRCIVAGFAILTALSLAGISRLEIETNYLEYFPKTYKARQDLEFFNRNLAGIGAYELVLSPENPDREIAADPEILAGIERLKSEAFKNPLTKEFYSHTAYIKKLNEVINEGDKASYRIPESREMTAQLLLLAASSGETEIDRYKTADDKKIHISIMTNLTSSELLLSYLKEMQKKTKDIFGPMGIGTHLTGFGPLWAELDHRILLSQIYSFLIAFVLVSVLMMFFLKSFRVGLISMIPNVLPIVFTMGLMGFLGIHLSVSTVMIAGVTIGITVDDTIHYLTRFKEFLKKTGDYDGAISLTNKSIGTAVVFTSTVLMGGFAVLCLGSFKPTVSFGGMVALTLFLSIFCEVFLLPLLLKTFKPFSVCPR